MMPIRAGSRYRLDGHVFKAIEVGRTHARLEPLTRGAKPLLIAHGDLYTVDEVGNTSPAGFALANLELLVGEIQGVFPWAPKPRRKRRRRAA